MPATIWCNVGLPPSALEELRAGTEGYRLVTEGPPEGEILFGQPETVGDARWVHVSTAGYTRYDTPAFREGLAARGAMLSNSSSVYDEPCAQHLLAMILAFARQIPQSAAEQIGARIWDDKARRADSWLLQDQTVLLVGYGAIARRVVELLAPFRLEVVAVRRKVRGDETVPTFPIEELDRLLPKADHVANVLPANASTDRLFDAGRFALMKPGAYFYNIGRGTTVDQAALLAARLAGAYLDVTDPEPLPPDHPLWTAPKVWITPHSAGGHRGEETRLVRHFLAQPAPLRGGRAAAGPGDVNRLAVRPSVAAGLALRRRFVLPLFTSEGTAAGSRRASPAATLRAVRRALEIIRS